MKIVKKPWGREIWWAYGNGHYVSKILCIEGGHRLSQQYHRKKHETIMVISGCVKLTITRKTGSKTKILFQGGRYVIPPGTIHRLMALGERAVVIEASTPETDDVVRLEDDYKRK